MAEEIKAEAAQVPDKTAAASGKKKAAAFLFVLLAAGAAAGSAWWVDSRKNISTDDAFVDGHVYQISSRVPGHVKAVLVGDNQPVKKGDLLVVLDRKDYETQAQDAAAAVFSAQNDVSSNYAKLDSAKAGLEAVKARLELARNDFKRGRDLFDRGAIARQDLDRLSTDVKVAESQLRDAEETVRKAQADIGLLVKGGNEAAVRQKKAQLEQARLNLSYTELRAPSDGYITRKGVEPGSNIAAGQPLMALVQLGDTWVTANYKESQITRVRPGQRVEFTLDAYPGRVFRGTVDSIMAGTGAAFSLLPPENATGNYVKVVQRIPVKVVVDKGGDPEHLLRMGMSVVPVIHTGLTTKEILKDALRF